MAGPSWLADSLAAVMIVIAVYCGGRLVASRLWRRPTAVDADGLHLVMGAAMAGMLVPRLGLLPAGAWEGVFGAAAAWFGLQAARLGRAGAEGSWRCRYPVPHLVECGAMLYMLLAAPGSRPAGAGAGMAMPAMSGPAGAARGFPALALVLALFMLGYVIWTADRLTSQAPAKPAENRAYEHTQVLATRGAAAASSPDAGQPPGTLDPAGAVRGRPEHPAGVPVLAPRLAECYKIAMGIAMGYMLVLML